MDALEILCIVFIALGFLGVIGLAIYVLAFFSHPDDNTKECKWLYRIVFVWSFSVAQFLYMTYMQDILASPRDDSMNWKLKVKYIWAALITIATVNQFTVIPFALVIYNSSKQRTLKQKIIKAVIITGIINVVGFGILLGILFGVDHYDVQYSITKVHFTEAKTSVSIWSYSNYNVIEKINLQVELTFFCCLFIALSLAGSCFFCISGGFGIASLPLERITRYLDRPKRRDAEDMTFTKLILRGENEKILNEAKQIKKEEYDYGQLTSVSQKKKLVIAYRKHKNELRDKYLQHQDVVDIVKKEEWKNQTQTNPLHYLCQLILGVFCLLLSFALILHTLFTIIPSKSRTTGIIYWDESTNTFLDGLMSDTSKYVAFIAGAFLYILICFFLQFSIQKGIDVLHFFGPSIFIGKMPFDVGKTWLNGFLMNTFIVTMGTQGMLTFLCNLFPQYLRLTTGYMYYHTMMRGLPYFKYIYKFKIVEMFTIVMFIITSVRLLVIPSERARIQTLMEAKRQQRSDNMKKDWKAATADIKKRDTARQTI